MVDLRKGLKLGVGSHTCDPNVKMLRQEDYCEFEEPLGYRVRTLSQKGRGER